MTLPEQSDRAVAQAREFLVRLCSPYGEGAIKKIRREVRAEALALLRHYPYTYQRTDENRCDGDMSGANVPSQCTLTTESLSCDTSVSIPVSERLSQKCDCPAPDNRASGDNVGSKLVHIATDTLTDEERGDITIWLAECLRQCSNATTAEDGECAERWRQRAIRAGQMLGRRRTKEAANMGDENERSVASDGSVAAC